MSPELGKNLAKKWDFQLATFIKLLQREQGAPFHDSIAKEVKADQEIKDVGSNPLNVKQ